MLFLGIGIAIASIIAVALISASSKKKEGISWPVVSGLIMGTLVGGSSTVGTAQLAYSYGLSAWWFTLGAGIACIIQALVYVKPLRENGNPTLVKMLEAEYGKKTGTAAAVLNSVGTFINVMSQFFSSSAVLMVVFPKMTLIEAFIIACVVMMLYVVFGGTKGAGITGILKLTLLYVAMTTLGIVACGKLGGFAGAIDTAKGFSKELGRNFLSLFCRGYGKDVGAMISLILGVLTTQTYAQAVINAKTTRDGKIGALVSAFMIPPIGVFGILVGLYMRTVTDPAVFVQKNALTSFILNYSGLSPLMAGLILGTIFITAVGGAAGLSLGIANMIQNQFLSKRKHKLSPQIIESLLISAILVLAMLVCLTPVSDTILQFSFMSMGLRGCTVFAPLCFIIWAKGSVKPGFAFASIITGSAIALIFGALNLFGVITMTVDAVIPGVIIATTLMIIGWFNGRKKA